MVDHAGRRTAPWELAQILTDPAVPHGWLLERRDRDDLAMLELAGAPLPTVVAVTWLDGDDARVAWLGVRGAPVGDDPRALATLVRPPDAAAALPQWESVSRLLARAARARALPAPAVGWDVLVTSEGPRIADCWNPRGSWHRRDAATRLDAAVVLAERTGGPVGWPLG